MDIRYPPPAVSSRLIKGDTPRKEAKMSSTPSFSTANHTT